MTGGKEFILTGVLILLIGLVTAKRVGDGDLEITEISRVCNTS